MRQHLRKFAMTLSWATVCGLVTAVTVGTGAAGASGRSRSGTIHAQLLDSTARIAPNGVASHGVLTGPNVMASFVAVMALLAMLFLVVTFIRRRARLA